MRAAGSTSGSDARGVQVTEFPGQQEATKQQDRQAHARRQRPGHFARPGAAVGTVAQHENQGQAQAGGDGEEGTNHKIRHARDYGLSARARFWLLTLGTALAMALTFALGVWQLSRAAHKQALQSQIDTRATWPVLLGPALVALSDPGPYLHRRVQLRGHWLASHTVFLDNRPMTGRVGFYVVTPLALEGGSAVVWVQRGWVARNFLDRTQLPALATPTGLVEVAGRLAPPPAKLYELGPPQSGPIRQNLDVSGYRAESGLPLLALSVQQTGGADDGLLRDWPRIGSGVERHYGYAFQWFGLCGLIALLYVWFQFVRRFRPPPAA